MRTFGENLRALRLSKGLSQEELARRLDQPRNNQISLWENDHRFPTIENILRLAEALRVPYKAMLIGVETPFDRIRAGKPVHRGSDEDAA